MSSQISTLLRHEGEGNLDKDRRSRPDFDSVSAALIAQCFILRSGGSRALRGFEISRPALDERQVGQLFLKFPWSILSRPSLPLFPSLFERALKGKSLHPVIASNEALLEESLASFLS